jgi:hypothetical protein
MYFVKTRNHLEASQLWYGEWPVYGEREMVSKFLCLIACCVAATVAYGQTSQSTTTLPRVNLQQQNVPRVITSQADLAFWTDLITQDSCTASQLADSLNTPNARQACDATDGDCQTRVGVAVLRACMTGSTITRLCEASMGSVGSPAFEECMAQQVNYDTRPVLFELSGAEVAVVNDALKLIESQIPTESDISTMTGLTLPERRLIIDAVSQFEAPTTAGCEGLTAAQRDFCVLQNIARAAEAKLAAASYILGQLEE